MKAPLIAVPLLAICGSLAPCQSTTSGKASASGSCNVSHSGNYDSISIKNCGIGAAQGKKIIELLNRVLANSKPMRIDLKLDELLKVASTPNEVVVQGPIDQSGEGCQQKVIGGNNNVNNCAPTAFHLSDAQEEKAAKDLNQHPVIKGDVKIAYEWSTPDGQIGAEELQKLLSSANINSTVQSAGMFMEYFGAPAYPGLSFGNVTESNRSLADAIEKALTRTGAVTTPIKKDEHAIGSDLLYIMIRKP